MMFEIGFQGGKVVLLYLFRGEKNKQKEGQQDDHKEIKKMFPDSPIVNAKLKEVHDTITKQGDELFNESKFPQASVLYERALRLIRLPETIEKLISTYRHLNKYRQIQDLYEELENLKRQKTIDDKLEKRNELVEQGKEHLKKQEFELAIKKFENAFDIVLTNPPFGSKGKVEDQQLLKSYLLARRWNNTQNGVWKATRNVLQGQSPEILFIEKSLKLLRPGGRMAIVLPDGLLQNISNSHIRFWIRSQAKVLGVVSIPQEAFVPYGTGIKTSLLLLQKLPSNTGKVFMARIQKIGYDVKLLIKH